MSHSNAFSLEMGSLYQVMELKKERKVGLGCDRILASLASPSQNATSGFVAQDHIIVSLTIPYLNLFSLNDYNMRYNVDKARKSCIQERSLGMSERGFYRRIACYL